MAIIATGSKTIIDLSDGKSLSVYLGTNQPRTQIYDVNSGTFQPDWSTKDENLIITPVVYANQTRIELTDVDIEWYHKEGSNNPIDLSSGETVSDNVLTVTQNKLSNITSGLLTYIANFAYTDPDTDLTINAIADINFSLIKTGQNAKSAWISGEQVFKYDADSHCSPTQIELTATLQNVTMSKWQYKNSSGDWVDYPTTSDNTTINSTILKVKPSHGIFVDNRAALRIKTSDDNISDETSIYKVYDGVGGASGQNASIAFLTNENITFAGNSSGVVSAVTKNCNVVAYSGTTKVTPTVGTISGCPTGMAVTAGTASNNEIPLSIKIASDSNLGGAGQLDGTINIPITSPVQTTLQIRWSKVNTGADGDPGFHLTVYSPTGTIFTNGKSESNSSTITLTAQFYEGSSDRTTSDSTKYLWEKYSSGGWSTYKAEAAGSNGYTCTVNASDVIGTATFRCKAKYGSDSTAYYYDTITITDKTDNYQADIDSTAGDVFKNGVGTTCLTCRLWQNGKEVDPPKSTTYSTSNPSSAQSGDFFYKITTTTATTQLMRYSGSAWSDVTNNNTYKHEKTYKWYRRDKDGNPMDNGSTFATGKVIYVDGDDVDAKTVFVCEVE